MIVNENIAAGNEKLKLFDELTQKHLADLSEPSMMSYKNELANSLSLAIGHYAKGINDLAAANNRAEMLSLASVVLETLILLPKTIHVTNAVGRESKELINLNEVLTERQMGAEPAKDFVARTLQLIATATPREQFAPHQEALLELLKTKYQQLQDAYDAYLPGADAPAIHPKVSTTSPHELAATHQTKAIQLFGNYEQLLSTLSSEQRSQDLSSTGATRVARTSAAKNAILEQLETAIGFFLQANELDGAKKVLEQGVSWFDANEAYEHKQRLFDSYATMIGGYLGSSDGQDFLKKINDTVERAEQMVAEASILSLDRNNFSEAAITKLNEAAQIFQSSISWTYGGDAKQRIYKTAFEAFNAIGYSDGIEALNDFMKRGYKHIPLITHTPVVVKLKATAAPAEALPTAMAEAVEKAKKLVAEAGTLPSDEKDKALPLLSNAAQIFQSSISVADSDDAKQRIYKTAFEAFNAIGYSDGIEDLNRFMKREIAKSGNADKQMLAEAKKFFEPLVAPEDATNYTTPYMKLEQQGRRLMTKALLFPTTTWHQPYVHKIFEDAFAKFDEAVELKELAVKARKIYSKLAYSQKAGEATVAASPSETQNSLSENAPTVVSTREPEKNTTPHTKEFEISSDVIIKNIEKLLKAGQRDEANTLYGETINLLDDMNDSATIQKLAKFGESLSGFVYTSAICKLHKDNVYSAELKDEVHKSIHSLAESDVELDYVIDCEYRAIRGLARVGAPLQFHTQLDEATGVGYLASYISQYEADAIFHAYRPKELLAGESTEVPLNDQKFVADIRKADLGESLTCFKQAISEATSGNAAKRAYNLAFRTFEDVGYAEGIIELNKFVKAYSKDSYFVKAIELKWPEGSEQKPDVPYLPQATDVAEGKHLGTVELPRQFRINRL